MHRTVSSAACLSDIPSDPTGRTRSRTTRVGEWQDEAAVWRTVHEAPDFGRAVEPLRNRLRRLGLDPPEEAVLRQNPVRRIRG